MAEDYLSAAKVQQLTELKGRAKVTFPYDDSDYPVIERIQFIPWEEWQDDLQTPDEEYPDAILILQQKLGEDDQFANVYRRWETLPGPFIPFTRYDENLGPVQGRRRAVLNTGQAASLTATAKTTYEARDTSALVAWEVQEGWSDGTGTAGNPVYPTNFSSVEDREKGAVNEVSQIVVDTFNLEGETTINGNVYTEVSYQPFSQFLLKRITSSYTLPGELLTENRRDDEKGPVKITTQLIAATGSETGNSVIAGSVVTDTAYEPINDLVLRRTITTFTVPCPAQTRYENDDETLLPVSITTQIIATPANGASFTFGLGSETVFRPLTDVYGRKVTTVFVPGINWAVASAQQIQRTKIGPYRFPELVFGIDSGSSGIYCANDGTTRLVLNWNRRAGRVANVPTTTLSYYGRESLLTLPASYFDPVLADLVYNGLFVNVSERAVLNDLIDFAAAVNSAPNPDASKWPGETIEHIGFPASALSATQYMDLVNSGSVQIVAAEKEEWKYGLWRMTVTKVPLR